MNILLYIKQNPQITIAEMCNLIGLSDKGLRKKLDKLKQQGLITRVGSDKGGHWQVNCENNSI